jgi:hypothetical protein
LTIRSASPRKRTQIDADGIGFCGVRFMAEERGSAPFPRLSRARFASLTCHHDSVDLVARCLTTRLP